MNYLNRIVPKTVPRAVLSSAILGVWLNVRFRHFLDSNPQVDSRLRTSIAFCAIVVLLLLHFVRVESVAQERENLNGLEFLAQVVSHSGEAEIQTGEFNYQLVRAKMAPTQDMIKSRVATQRQAIENQIKTISENLENTPDNKGLEQYISALEKALDSVEESVAGQMTKNASQNLRFEYLVGKKGRYVECSRLNWEDDKVSSHFKLLTRRELNTLECIFFDSLSRMATSTSTSAYAGSQDPVQFGRINGTIAQVAAFKDAPVTKFVREVNARQLKGEFEVETFEVTGRFQSFQSTHLTTAFKLHVVPSRGYVTPLIQEMDSTGRVIAEWKSEQYFQPKGQDRWYPEIFLYRTLLHEPSTESYVFNKDQVILGNDIDENRLRLLLPNRMTYLDARTQSNQKSYTANRDVYLTLDGLSELENNTALTRVVVQ